MSIRDLIRAAVKWRKTRPLRASSPPPQSRKTRFGVDEEGGTPDGSSTALTTIMADRVRLHHQIDAACRAGTIADAIPASLYSNHRSELAARQCELDAAEQNLRRSLSRLEAAYPEPSPPPPVPPAPRPPQYFPRIGNLLGQREPKRTSH
jgi:hypothetical protein